jgi:hypothetical protein
MHVAIRVLFGNAHFCWRVAGRFTTLLLLLGEVISGLQLSQTVYVHAPRPLLVELANAADDAKALLAIIQSGEARLAVALAVVEGDPSPENDGGGEEVAALHSRRSIRRGAAGAGPTIRRVMQ